MITQKDAAEALDACNDEVDVTASAIGFNVMTIDQYLTEAKQALADGKMQKLREAIEGALLFTGHLTRQTKEAA